MIKFIHKKSTQKGFTLIEMMVSVALFSIVLVVALGAILTVLDSNRKAQTLTSVMNNLNFALESMTRSIKTGVDPVITGTTKITVDGIDLSQTTDFTRQKVNYKFLEEGSGPDKAGYIGRCFGASCGSDNKYVRVTAPEVDIDKFVLLSDGFEDGFIDSQQPRTFIFLEGKVVFSERIKSVFRIQTTVSQRRLDIQGQEAYLLGDS